MHRWVWTALVLLGCGEGSVTLDVYVARAEDDPFGERTCYSVRAQWEGGARSTNARRIEDLRLEDLEPSTYDFLLEAIRSRDGSTGCDGVVIGRARTFDVEVRRGEDVSVPLVLVPMDRIARLPFPDWAVEWFAERSELAAVAVTDRGGEPTVVFSGGRLADGTIGRDLLVYEPRRFELTLLEDRMSCARAGHAAAAIGLASDDQRVLLVGGDGECDDGAASQSSAELFDPGDGTIARTGAPVGNLPRPVTSVAPGGAVFVMGSGPGGQASEAEPRIQRFDGSEFLESLADPRIPSSGGSISPVFADGRGPWIVAGGRRQDGSLIEGVTLYEWRQEALEPCSIEGDPVGLSGDEVEITPTRYGEVLLTGAASDGGRRWWRIWPDPGCESVARVVSGDLSLPRQGHVATPLADGQVILTGSDAGGTAELYMPAVGTTMAIEPGTARFRTGHVAVGLEDGSVLIAGGGPREVEVFLPRDAASDRFGWDEDAEPKPRLDVLVVVSNSAEARQVTEILRVGGYLDSAGLRIPAGPAGLLEAIEPLDPSSDNEFLDPDIQIEVTTGDMRCEGRAAGGGGQLAGCGDPLQSSQDAQGCLLEALAAGEGCPAQELFRAMIDAAEVLDDDRRDVPLLILIAAPRDDCSSSDTDPEPDLFEPSEVPLTTRCATEEELLDPEAVVGALGTLRSNPELVSILTIGGPDEPLVRADGNEAPAACADIRPTPRLAALARAHGAGRGHHVDVCQASPSYPPLEWWSDLVDSRIGDRVCLPYAPRDSTEPSCAVTFDRDLGGGVHEAVRLGYRFLPSTPGSESAQCENGVLELTDPLAVPIGEEAAYACQ